jgi:predicted metal-dependent hydrolase
MSTQMSLPFLAEPPPPPPEPARGLPDAGRRAWTVTYVRHRRARHYVLRVQEDGSVRVTIPRGGSRKDAERFAAHKAGWIERERARRAATRARPGAWGHGSEVLVRGEARRLEVDLAAGVARLGDETIPLGAAGVGTLHAMVTERLRRLAERDLPARLMGLAASLGHRVSRVTVRDQRSRWGSCSVSGRISLNWRLIQVPPSVCDYVLLHELTHLVVGNHSERFWTTLETVCPWHREARAWLRLRFSGTMSDPWSPHIPTDQPGKTRRAQPA